MLIDVTMPQLGESVSEGTISKWRVREGDVVKKDDPLVEIATDKAYSELPAPHGGRVVRILAQEGDVVAVKAVLCQIDDSAQPAVSEAAPAPSVPAPRVSGVVPAGPPQGDGGSVRSVTGSAFASPTIRREALERDVNLDEVRGSGERGRITKDDVLRASQPPVTPVVSPPPVAPPPAPPVPPPAPAPRPPSSAAASLATAINQGGGFMPPVPGVGYGSFKVPAYRPNEGDQVIPFTRRRRITADHMSYSKVVSPHVVTVA